ncbi:response regulator [Dyella solisilvae]|nr:response regulator transcription factor [Dyella solisilvae]
MEAEGTSAALAKHFRVIGCVSHGRELFSLILRTRPDVIVTDLRLAGAGGIEVLRRLQNAGTSVPFVFFSSMTDRASVRQAMASGARAFVSKADGLTALRVAVGHILNGRTYVSPRLAEETPKSERSEPPGITRRQRQILELLGAGMRNQQIADELGLSRRTIEGYRAGLSKAARAHLPQNLAYEAE